MQKRWFPLMSKPQAIRDTNSVLSNNMGQGKMAFISRKDCALAATHA